MYKIQYLAESCRFIRKNHWQTKNPQPEGAINQPRISQRMEQNQTVRQWGAYLSKPVDGASLAAFRVLFGLLLVWEVIRYYSLGRIEHYYITPTFHFTYPFLDFIKPWSGNGMYIHFAVMGVLAGLIALGLFYRLSSLLFFLAFSYVFLLDKALYLNHFYLIALLSFLLSIVPAHHAFSLDRLLFFRTRAPLAPLWSVLILRAQVFIVYFYGGLTKLNPDWLRGEPMRMWLAERTDFPLIGSAFTSEWVVYFFTYGGLLFDLGIGFLLVWRRTRPLAFGFAGLFHWLNSRLFSIGIFPYLAFGATLIFAEPDWPLRVMRAAQRWFNQLRVNTQSLPAMRAYKQISTLRGNPITSSWPILVMAHIYLVMQLVVPLRHLLYPGNVSWTEEGHRFSWHMKLRDKEAEIHFYIVDPRNGETWEVSPAIDLSAKQIDEMSTRPDMVLQYAHYLADKFSVAGLPRPTVRVAQQVSLNGRPYSPLIDPLVNLAEVPVSFGSAGWILDLEAPLKPLEHLTAN